MKRPSKNKIQYLRLAIGMTGKAIISDSMADLILTTQSEMKRLGGKFSLRDAAKIADELDKIYEPKICDCKHPDWVGDGLCGKCGKLMRPPTPPTQKV